jgi:hypothetical protein
MSADSTGGTGTWESHWTRGEPWLLGVEVATPSSE